MAMFARAEGSGSSPSPSPSPSSFPGDPGIVITDANKAPLLQLTTWLALSLMALIVGIRFLTRFFIKISHPAGLEDVFMMAAFLFAVGESVTMIIPASDIYGKDMGAISTAELVMGIKAGYARDALFIITLGLSKISVCAGLFDLSPDRVHRILTRALGGFITIWTIVSVIVSLFECGVEGPWVKNPACADRPAFLTSVAIINIVTDVALVVLPIAIIAPLHMALKLRLTVIAFYVARIPAIIVTICQITYLPLLRRDNWTLDAFPYFLCLQLVQFASILAACTTCFWPFLRSLRSGLLWSGNANFTSHHALSKINFTKTGGGGGGGSGNQPSSSASISITHPEFSVQSHNNRNRKDYIEITTDVDVQKSRRGKEDVGGLGEPYRHAWERS